MRRADNGALVLVIQIQIIIFSFFMEIVSRNIVTILSWTAFTLISALYVAFHNSIVYNKYFVIYVLLLYCIFALTLVKVQYITSIIYSFTVFNVIIVTLFFWFTVFAAGFSLLTFFRYILNYATIVSILTVVECFLKRNIIFGLWSRADSSNYKQSGKAQYVPYGSFGNHIVLSIYLILIIILSTYIIRYYKYYVITLLFASLGVLMSGVRTAYLAVAILFLYFVLRSILMATVGKRSITTLVFSLILLIGVFMLFKYGKSVSFVELINQRIEALTGRESASGRHRFEAIRIVFGLYAEASPLVWFWGSGSGTIAAMMRTQQIAHGEMSGFYVIDNQWMESLYDGGLFLIIPLVVIFCKAIAPSLDVSKTSKDGYSVYLSFAFITYLIFMFSFETFTWVSSASIFGLLLALMPYSGQTLIAERAQLGRAV